MICTFGARGACIKCHASWPGPLARWQNFAMQCPMSISHTTSTATHLFRQQHHLHFVALEAHNQFYNATVGFGRLQARIVLPVEPQFTLQYDLHMLLEHNLHFSLQEMQTVFTAVEEFTTASQDDASRIDRVNMTTCWTICTFLMLQYSAPVNRGCSLICTFCCQRQAAH